MKTRNATQEFVTIQLQANQKFYLPMLEKSVIEKIEFSKKNTVYKVSVVEDFKEITNGVTGLANDAVVVNLNTKCLVLEANQDTEVEILILK